jgi:hypothetical protein
LYLYTYILWVTICFFPPPPPPHPSHATETHIHQRKELTMTDNKADRSNFCEIFFLLSFIHILLFISCLQQ